MAFDPTPPFDPASPFGFDESAGDDRSFDELLRLASWPEPGAKRLARLRNRWTKLRATPLRPSAWSLLAVAACVALATGAAFWRWQGLPQGADPLKDSRILADAGNPREREVPTEWIDDDDADRGSASPNAGESSQRPSPNRNEVSSPSDRLSDPADSRPANLWERVALSGASRPASKRHILKAKSPRDLAIEQVIERPYAASEIAEMLAAERVSLERDLRRSIERSRTTDGHERILPTLSDSHLGNPRVLAAVRLLAEIATESSVPLLRRLAGSPVTRVIALESLAWRMPPAEVAQLARRESDAALRTRLLIALVERDSDRALDEFLALVRDPSMASLALSSLGRVETPPLERLFAAVTGPRVDDRAPATMVLSRLGDPAVTERLYELLSEDERRFGSLLEIVRADSDVVGDPSIMPNCVQSRSRAKSREFALKVFVGKFTIESEREERQHEIFYFVWNGLGDRHRGDCHLGHGAWARRGRWPNRQIREWRASWRHG